MKIEKLEWKRDKNTVENMGMVSDDRVVGVCIGMTWQEQGT